MAGTMTTDDLYAMVQEWTTVDHDAALAQLAALLPANRSALEQVRNRFAARLHGHSDDYQATTALALLNRALASEPTLDPLDWKLRWGRGRKP